MKSVLSLYLFFILVAAQSGAEEAEKKIIGHVDSINEVFIQGWSCDTSDFSVKPEIEVRVNSQFVGRVTAATPRELPVTLLCGGNQNESNSRRGFFIDLPESVKTQLSSGPVDVEVMAISGSHPPVQLARQKLAQAVRPPHLTILRGLPELQPDMERSVIFPKNIGEMLQLPTKRFAVALWHLWARNKSSVGKRISSDLTACTGITISKDRERFQRGVSTNGRDALTYVQMQNGETGICLNSATPFEGQLLASTPFYLPNTDLSLWTEPASYRMLKMSLDLRVPRALRRNSGQAYIVAYYGFQDRRSRRYFWYGAQLFDLRPAMADQAIVDSCANCTGWPIVFGSVDGGAYTQRGLGSSQFRSAPWTSQEGFSKFSFAITKENFANAIAAIRNTRPEFSADLSDYSLWGVFLNPEVYVDGELGLAFKNWEVTAD